MPQTSNWVIPNMSDINNPKVPVQNPDGTPAMPTKASRARRKVQSKEATEHWSDLGIYYIRLVKEPSGRATQPIFIGNDPGKRYSGIAVQSTQYTLAMFHLVLMGFIPKQGTAIAGVHEKMKYRSMLRRGRRGRRIDRTKPFKLRNHRQKRFSNRKQPKIPPSIRSNRMLELRVIKELCKLYPVTAVVQEIVKADVDRTSGRKGAKSGKGFSPVMVGQNWMVQQLSEFVPVITRYGWQKDGNGTSQIRKQLRLEKNKADKAKPVPETHAVDAVSLAASCFIQYESFHSVTEHGHQWVGEVNITPAWFKVVSKPRITRRRLHDAVPAKGGVRERYGGSTTPFDVRKGDLVEYRTKVKGEEKTVIGYCSGYTGNNLSLSDANWSRLGRFSYKKCRVLKRNTGLVVSGASNPAQLPSYPPYDQAQSRYGRSAPEVA